MEIKMNSDIKIGIIGGDLRQLTVADELVKEGFEVALFGFDRRELPDNGAVRCADYSDIVKKSRAVVLPLPYSCDGQYINLPHSDSKVTISDFFSLFSKGQVVVGGRLDSHAYSLAENSGVYLADYFEREELLVRNAVPTAEGAVGIAVSELPITIRECRATVVGYGRVGQALASLLTSMGSSVTVVARKQEALAWARSRGCFACHISRINHAVRGADIVFNTVPERLLTSEVLKEMRPEALIIDLASKPGGVDRDVAGARGLRVIWALSLPGKTAPVTAGIIIKDSIMSILRESGVMPL